MNISLKEKIKLWFDFLRLAHESKDPQVVASLLEHAAFYEPWGDYRSKAFTPWWAEHRHLFRSISTMRKMQSNDVLNEDALFLVVPFTYAPTTAAAVFKRIYEEEQQRRGKLRSGKVKKVYAGEFALTTDDFQASQFAYYLRFTKDVYLALQADGGDVSTKQYVDAARKAFAKQRLVTSLDEGKSKRGVPFKDSSSDYVNLSRRARDYVQITENLLRNVSAGKFPGDYLTTSVRNQGAKRKTEPVYKKRKFSKGVPASRYVAKRT
jgi:hypothetical protein